MGDLDYRDWRTDPEGWARALGGAWLGQEVSLSTRTDSVADG